MPAKMEKLSKSVNIKMMEEPTRLSINLKKYPKLEKDVGEKCSGYFEGKVVRVSKDEYGWNQAIEVTKLESYPAKKSQATEEEDDGDSE